MFVPGYTGQQHCRPDSDSDCQVYFICLTAKLGAPDRKNDSGPNLHCPEPKSFELIKTSLHHRICGAGSSTVPEVITSINMEQWMLCLHDSPSHHYSCKLQYQMCSVWEDFGVPGSWGPVTAEASQHSFAQIPNLPGSRTELENGF